ncbi:hypothetical protein ACHAXA_007919 [Cyclostephanos tholiformis]|uniref:Peptidase S1 domain-containing protein n=1 Tax=Cyclostephanos tholiformis TaxID=382380 RepID=A0ABD3SI38_9STRA
MERTLGPCPLTAFFSFFSALLLTVPVVSSDLVMNVEDISSISTFAEDSRIIGGWEAQVGRYMYAVSLQSYGIGHFCGGTLIAKDVVITAAHCVRDGSVTAVIGGNTVDEGEKINVIKSVTHDNYNSITDGYDVGLLILESSTTLDITFPVLNIDNDYPSAGATTYAMGWGDTDVTTYEKVSDWLMVVDLEVITNEDCNAAEEGDVSYRNWVTDDMMCTYSENRDACQGDSGGPLIVRPGGGAEYDILVGLVSWGVGCAYLPGVFSRVSMSYDWILNTTCAESKDPTGSLCELNRISGSDNLQTSSSTAMSPPPKFFPTSLPIEQPTSTPSLSSEPTSGYPSSEPPPRSQKAAKPEISTLQEDVDDSVILEEEESKAPINSSLRLSCKFVAVVAVSGMISMYVML